MKKPEQEILIYFFLLISLSPAAAPSFWNEIFTYYKMLIFSLFGEFYSWRRHFLGPKSAGR
jgi:hypothetical protein